MQTQSFIATLAPTAALEQLLIELDTLMNDLPVDSPAGFELPLWTGPTRTHPLRHYQRTQLDLSNMRRLSDVKSIVRPTEVRSIPWCPIALARAEAAV